MSALIKGEKVYFSNSAFPHLFNKRYTFVKLEGGVAIVTNDNGDRMRFGASNIDRIGAPAWAPAPPPIPPKAPEPRTALPKDSAMRKEYPVFSGCVAYFPAALSQVARHSWEGNEKHNPGLPLQHARGISGDHEDCIMRHLIDAKEHRAGSIKRLEELRAAAWRVLALLQEECEVEIAPPAPAATFNRSK